MEHLAVIKGAKREKGYVTIEASVSMVCFLFAIVSLLSVINIGRLQAHLGKVLNQSALFMSQNSYMYYISGMYSVSTEIKETAYNAEQTLKDPEYVTSMMEETFRISNSGQISADPAKYVRTLLLAGISNGLSAAESRLITAPLSKALFIGTLEQSGMDADLFLKSRGVLNGTAGLDFNMSSMFSAETPCDICLTLCYEVSIPFLPGLRVAVMQNATTGAWLGGDKTEQNLASADKTSDDTKTDSEVDSVWDMDPLKRGKYFADQFRSERGFSEKSALPDSVIGFDALSNTYYGCVSINTFSPGYNDLGFSAASASRNTITKVKNAIQSIQADSENRTKTVCIDYTIFIPEDTPTSDLGDLRKCVDQKATQINARYPQFQVNFNIRQEGGKANE